MLFLMRRVIQYEVQDNILSIKLYYGWGNEGGINQHNYIKKIDNYSILSSNAFLIKKTKGQLPLTPQNLTFKS